MREDQGYVWRKSSYSTDGGGANCVEVGWRVSSYSTQAGGNCVEAGPVTGEARVVAVRDTKYRSHGHLAVSRTTWATFVRGVTR